MKTNDKIIHSGIWVFWLAGLYIGLRYAIRDIHSVLFALWIIWFVGMSFLWLVSLGDLVKIIIAKIAKKYNTHNSILNNKENEN